MPDYPKWLQLEPVREWPGELRTRRKHGPFKSTMTDTSRKLAYELERIKGTNPRLLIAATAEQFTLDGSRLRAGVTPWHPGVVLVFDSPIGQQRYPSDGYLRWQHNLHAIALTLEALRGIDRWEVSTGQQYGGFLAIESARAMPSTPFGREPESVRRWLFGVAGLDEFEAVDSRTLLRKAQAATHPDLGGDADQFLLVATAEEYLREAGQL